MFLFYNSVKRLQDGTYTFPTLLLMTFAMYLSISESIPIFFVAILVSLPIQIRTLWIENKDKKWYNLSKGDELYDEFYFYVFWYSFYIYMEISN